MTNLLIFIDIKDQFKTKKINLGQTLNVKYSMIYLT